MSIRAETLNLPHSTLFFLPGILSMLRLEALKELLRSCWVIVEVCGDHCGESRPRPGWPGSGSPRGGPYGWETTSESGLPHSPGSSEAEVKAKRPSWQQSLLRLGLVRAKQSSQSLETPHSLVLLRLRCPLWRSRMAGCSSERVTIGSHQKFLFMSLTFSIFLCFILVPVGSAISPFSFFMCVTLIIFHFSLLVCLEIYQCSIDISPSLTCCHVYFQFIEFKKLIRGFLFTFFSVFI